MKALNYLPSIHYRGNQSSIHVYSGRAVWSLWFPEPTSHPLKRFSQYSETTSVFINTSTLSPQILFFHQQNWSRRIRTIKVDTVGKLSSKWKKKEPLISSQATGWNRKCYLRKIPCTTCVTEKNKQTFPLHKHRSWVERTTLFSRLLLSVIPSWQATGQKGELCRFKLTWRSLCHLPDLGQVAKLCLHCLSPALVLT